jgi:hypothetical protein
VSSPWSMANWGRSPMLIDLPSLPSFFLLQQGCDRPPQPPIDRPSATCRRVLQEVGSVSRAFEGKYEGLHTAFFSIPPGHLCRRCDIHQKPASHSDTHRSEQILEADHVTSAHREAGEADRGTPWQESGWLFQLATGQLLAQSGWMRPQPTDRNREVGNFPPRTRQSGAALWVSARPLWAPINMPHPM